MANMKNKTFVIITFLFLAGIPFSSFASDDYYKPDCSRNQIQMNACLSLKADKMEEQMNALLEKKLSKLSEKSQKRLRDSQEAWEKYRAKTCTYEEGDYTDGGSAHGMLLNKCRTKMAKERIEKLQSYIDCSENGCPL